jgi:putative ABC transport system permease protein
MGDLPTYLVSGDPDVKWPGEDPKDYNIVPLRFKEIGVRKVLAASVGGIVRLLAREFLLPVLLATLIAFPVAGWAMSKWLHGFAFRIGVEWL